MRQAKIVICDDEKEILRYLKKILHSHGYAVDVYAEGKTLLDRLEADPAYIPDLLVQDINMPELSGIDILKKVRKLRPALPVVIMTAFGSIDSAVHAIKLGAYDYITKPFPKEKLLAVLEKALERESLLKENLGLKAELTNRSAPGEIIFVSNSYRMVYDMTLQVAGSEANILIQGESGTGKELIARAIHENSARREQRYLTINCAALTDTLLESQLFGHTKGAFTGAVASKKGLLDAADGGTLFLDEIGDMPLSLQVKLLRVIQEREFTPVGSTATRNCDIRIVAATNKELEREVAEGRFREDLFYRLNVISLHPPPLRERKEDLEPLARHFIAKYSARMKKHVDAISTGALELLHRYHFPGNIRELENIIERAVILARSPEISADLLPIRTSAITPVMLPAECSDSLESVERQHIQCVLKKNANHKSRSAEILGITRKTLDRKIADYGLIIPRGGSEPD
ncbi:MAG TPA: sigma-54-dependent Fis family transcriptional regulator [Desulfuromonadales bacterium]|nr:sigma-54-dependent Fis family transcriptional regulator [Desulfuromonadales bacterium]